MTYAPHTLIAFGGSLSERAVGDEIWQCGIRANVVGGSTIPQAKQATYLAAIQAGLSTWFASANAYHSPESKLAWIKCNAIGADGKYIYPTTTRYDYATPVAGSGTTNGIPAFTNAVYSWTTAVARGVAARGRIYPPNVPTCAVGSTLSSTRITGFLAAAKALLSVIANSSSADPDLQLVPVIASAGGRAGTGLNRAITGVRIGSIADYQSRRKDALPELYTTSAWP